MTNRTLIIQRNTSHPINDTPRTLYMVRLAWLLNKPLVANALKDLFSMKESPQTMISETILIDPLTANSLDAAQVLNDLEPAQALEDLPETEAIEALIP
jgi:hypothetical protein